MGRDKAFLRVDGVTLLERAIATVRGLPVREVLISGRWDADYSGYGCLVLHDSLDNAGPLGGIERGLRHAVASHLLVLAVDLARMESDYLAQMHARCERLRGVIGRRRGQLEPLAAIYPTRCHVFAAQGLWYNRLSVRAFAEACLREKALLAFRVLRRDESRFANWNTPEDLGQ
jgi:molybdopterin-guanine dinucleotide biosynthesis protein A